MDENRDTFVGRDEGGGVVGLLRTQGLSPFLWLSRIYTRNKYHVILCFSVLCLRKKKKTIKKKNMKAKTIPNFIELITVFRNKFLILFLFHGSKKIWCRLRCFQDYASIVSRAQVPYDWGIIKCISSSTAYIGLHSLEGTKLTNLNTLLLTMNFSIEWFMKSLYPRLHSPNAEWASESLQQVYSTTHQEQPTACECLTYSMRVLLVYLWPRLLCMFIPIHWWEIS